MFKLIKSLRKYFIRNRKILTSLYILEFIIYGILDLNVETTNFKTFQPSFGTFLSDTAKILSDSCPLDAIIRCSKFSRFCGLVE